MYPDITHRVSYMYMIILLINFLALIFWPVFTLWLVWCGWGENEIHVMGNFFMDTYCSTYFVGDCKTVSECHFSWDYPPGYMDWHLLSFLWNIWMMSACVLILVGVSYTDDMMKTRVFVAQECSLCDSTDLFVFETLMVVQLKSKFCIQWLLACWLSVNGVMNFPDFIQQIWHICGLQCYCSEINVTWLCTVLDWFFRALSVIMNLILNEVLCVVK